MGSVDEHLDTQRTGHFDNLAHRQDLSGEIDDMGELDDAGPRRDRALDRFNKGTRLMGGVP